MFEFRYLIRIHDLDQLRGSLEDEYRECQDWDTEALIAEALYIGLIPLDSGFEIIDTFGEPTRAESYRQERAARALLNKHRP